MTTSLALLDTINAYRVVEKKPEMKHKRLLDIIREEFDYHYKGDLTEAKRRDSRGKMYPIFHLTNSQCIHLLTKISYTFRLVVSRQLSNAFNENFTLLKEPKK